MSAGQHSQPHTQAGIGGLRIDFINIGFFLRDLYVMYPDMTEHLHWVSWCPRWGSPASHKSNCHGPGCQGCDMLCLKFMLLTSNLLLCKKWHKFWCFDKQSGGGLSWGHKNKTQNGLHCQTGKQIFLNVAAFAQAPRAKLRFNAISSAFQMTHKLSFSDGP